MMSSASRFAHVIAVLAGPLAFAGCGEVDPAPPEDTSGTVILDGAQAFAVTFDSPACDFPDWPCGAVRRFERAGGASTVIARAKGINDALAIDDGYVYFVSTTGTVFNEGGPTDESNVVTTLARVPKVGGATSVIATLPHAAVSGLVVQGKTVYFTTRGVGPAPTTSSLWSVPANGGAISVLATTTGGSVTQLVADNASLYWALRLGDGGRDHFVIRKTPLGGEKDPTIFARGDGWLEGMTLDATALYVTNHGFEATEGSVTAFSLAAGTPRTLATGLRNVGAIAVDDARVAWVMWESAAPAAGSQKGELRAVAKGGGPQTTALTSIVAASISADSSGLCASVLFSPKVVCVAR